MNANENNSYSGWTWRVLCLVKEVRKRKINIIYIYDITYIWNLENKTSEYNKKETHRYREQIVVTSRERIEGGAI